jgi:hypothetical protein
MFTHSKRVLIVICICVLLCTMTLMGQRPNVRPGQSPVPATEPVAALVEAFVVEVNLPALAKLGVSPIGEEPHAASVADILKCLDAGQARVIAGAKAACDQGQTHVQAADTTYVVRQKGPQGPTDYRAFESGETFSVIARAAPDSTVTGTMSVEFKLSNSMFRSKTQTPDTPPDRTTWEWNGTIALKPGRPGIAAATQDGRTTVFLLLTAHLQDQ